MELLFVHFVFNSSLEFVAHGDHQAVHGADFFDLQILDLAVQNVSWIRHTARHPAMSHKLHCQAFAHSTCYQVGKGVVVAIGIVQQLAHKGPAARSSECTAGALAIKVVQVLFGKAQVTNHVFVDVIEHRPFLPRRKVHFHFLVNETICQRSGHTISHTLVAFAITCCYHNNIVRQLILANTTIQNQLISSGLHTGRGTVEFVHEQYHQRILAGQFFVRQFHRGCPIHLADFFVVKRNTTNVSGFHLPQTQVNHITVEVSSNALHQLALANAGGTPQEQRTLDFECFKQGFVRLAGGNCT